MAATVTIAATYIYFLIFAQFGFIKAVEAAGLKGHSLLRPIMAVMGMAGIAAGLTWVARTPAWLLLCAALTGTGPGMVTAGLAGMLRREIDGGRLGLCIGVGTGIAYAV